MVAEKRDREKEKERQKVAANNGVENYYIMCLLNGQKIGFRVVKNLALE